MERGDTDDTALGRTIWWRLVPFLVILYVIAIIDRVNIGYAALTMNADLGIGPQAFGFISGIFFLSYVICEVPSNQFLVRTGSRIWLTRIMVCWGFITLLMAFVRTPAELAILRFLLGAAEAGLTPGIMLYLTFWFPKNRLSRAIAVFSIAIPLAMVIASPISTLILTHATWAGLAPWRWLFVIEGIPAIIFGALILVFLPDSPRDAAWLSGPQRARLMTELGVDRVKNETPRAIPFSQIGKTPGVLLFCISSFLVGLFLTSLLFWIPKIVDSSGLSGSLFQTGLLVMIPYALSAVAMYVWACHSDRSDERRWHIAGPFLAAAGFLVLLALPTGPLAGFLLLTGAITACHMTFAPFFALTLESFAPGTRPAGVAFVNAIASTGSFTGPVILGLAGGDLASPAISALFLLLGIAIGACAILIIRSGTGTIPVT